MYLPVTRTETLSAVSFYTTDTNTAYQVYVYKNPDSGPVISSSGAAWSGSGTFGNAGYHTIVVSPGVSLVSGDKFSVVVRLTNPSYDYWAPVEYYSTSHSYKSSKATASAGQSYFSTGGTSWTDLTAIYTKSNFCIKAFTNDAGSSPSNSSSITGIYRPGAGFYLKMNNGSTWNPSTDRYLAWDNAVNRSSRLPVTGMRMGEPRPACIGLVSGSISRWIMAARGIHRPIVYLAWDNAVIDLPIAGDWNADGRTETGVYRPGAGFYLKMDNGSTWNPSTDRLSGLG